MIATSVRALAACTLLFVAACAMPPQEEAQQAGEIQASRMAFAMSEVNSLKDQGARVWCVPFARNLSGIQIRGNAREWWGQAEDVYQQAGTPQVGAVMAFKATRGMPLGHVAVVSEIVNPREIRVDHANWHRNKVSLGMAVIDVSKANDWSEVRLEQSAGQWGSVYPIAGFILPDPA